MPTKHKPRPSLLEISLLIAALAVPLAYILFGAFPLIMQCGRLPIGSGESVNYVFGWWSGC